MSEQITPFLIDIADDDLMDLRDRLSRTRWPEPATVADWSQGVPLSYLQEFCRYWAEDYQWRVREKMLNQFPQFRTTIDSLGIHFLHVTSPEPGAFPLILTHGWPGSVTEFTDIIGPLTDPVAHGGDASDAFHLVVPSLPGFGFSDKPAATGWGPDRIADVWATLMARLGYDRYGAQGGDAGAVVSSRLGARHPEHLAGVHFNFVSGQPDPAQTKFTPDERAKLTEMRKRNERLHKWESGYLIQQSSRAADTGLWTNRFPGRAVRVDTGEILFMERLRR